MHKDVDIYFKILSHPVHSSLYVTLKYDSRKESSKILDSTIFRE